MWPEYRQREKNEAQLQVMVGLKEGSQAYRKSCNMGTEWKSGANYGAHEG
jgi:hypothetical protein